MVERRTARDLRRANRETLLRSLYFEGAASRVELAARTGLSPATVSTLAAALSDEELVVSAGLVDSDGGRPATLLEVRSDRAFSIGVDVGETGIQAELFNLRLERVQASHRSLPTSGLTPDDVVATVADAVGELRQSAQGHELLGVGVGVPGIVDGHSEVVVHAPSLGWRGVPLQAMLTEVVDGPVYLDNGAKTMGRAESWFGAGRGVADLVVILIGTGVGAALINSGAVYRGSSSSAGEWGHTKIALDGASCRCGSRGCMEAYIGAGAIADRHRRLDPGLPSVASQVAAIDRLAHDAKCNVPAALAALQETATYLAAGIAGLANLLNPAKVVVGGFVGLRLGPLLLPLVEARLPEYALAPAWERLTLAVSQFGPDAVALGAATLPVERFFNTGGVLPLSKRVAKQSAVHRVAS